MAVKHKVRKQVEGAIWSDLHFLCGLIAMHGCVPSMVITCSFVAFVDTYTVVQ